MPSGDVLDCAFGKRLGLAHGAAEGKVFLEAGAEQSNTLGFVHGGAIASLALAACELEAVESQRSAFTFARPLSLSISYLRALRSGTLAARSEVGSRGREAVHLNCVVSEGDGPQAARLAATWWMQVSERSQESALLRGRRPAAWYDDGATPRDVGFSPYTATLGAQITRCDEEGAAMHLPLRGNEAANGRLHEGAILGAVDTCAALAAKEWLAPEPFSGGATLSISMMFVAPAMGDIRLDARCLSAAGEAFTQDVEVTDRQGGLLATASVVYRLRRTRVV